MVFIPRTHPQTSSNWSKKTWRTSRKEMLWKSANQFRKTVYKLIGCSNRKEKTLNVTRSSNLGWFCSEFATRMCSVKFTFFDIVVIFSFTVKSIAIDIQSGFWTLSRLFLCKTQQALCMTQRDSLCTVPGQGAVHKLCRHRPSFLYLLEPAVNTVLCRLCYKQTMSSRKGEGGSPNLL